MLTDIFSNLESYFDPNAHTELRGQCNKSRRATLIAGNLAGNSSSMVSGVSSRVYKDGLYGFSSSAEYDRENAKNVLLSATKNADFMSSHVNNSGFKMFPKLPAGAIRTDRDIKDIEQRLYIDYIKEIDAYIAEKYKDLSSRFITATADSMEKILKVSNGFASHSIMPRSYIYVGMTMEDDDGQPFELYEIFGGGDTFDVNFKNPRDQFERIDRLYDKMLQKKHAVYSDAGLKTCILAPMLAGMLAHEAVGHTVEADLVLGGSVAGSCLGKQVASEKVSMVDYAYEAFGKATPLPIYVDDEGTKAEDQVLINNGILTGYMNNRESAHHFNMTPNGNARAYSFSDEPLIRMRNTAVLPGTDRLSDMIASVDDGYYLVDTNNGQADTTGEFMFGITMGYEIKNGKLGRPIKETTISGVAFDMLKTVDMVSDELEWFSSGYCGKKQPMPVGMGGPSIKCKVNIGGR